MSPMRVMFLAAMGDFSISFLLGSSSALAESVPLSPSAAVTGSGCFGGEVGGGVVSLSCTNQHDREMERSWECTDCGSSSFTSDITPLILAAHKNNYEIVKILLDRGATLPIPHDIKCGCDDCVELSKTNSLRHSQARINIYRALISPSLIALSSRDPLLTAFDLSKELRKLGCIEAEFRVEYNDMRSQVQKFSTSLLDYVRTSFELEVILNYDPNCDNWEPGGRPTLERLRVAIKYEQKKFVAHPNVQQLLAAIWYEGVPGFRRKNVFWQFVQIVKLAIMFPLYCAVYILAPMSQTGQFIRKPFVKFICHSASYIFFLLFVSVASQKLEIVLLEQFSSNWVKELVEEWKRRERGAILGVAECVVVLYVISFIWAEIKELWASGLREFLSDLWNFADFVTNMFYVTWIGLRLSSYCIVWREAQEGKDPWYPREQWHSFDPMLLSEGAFAAGMILSFLKLVHIFSISPHLGPLQISLGRMIFDIMKFFCIYMLVLFAFACGLNQLLWYYAELERDKCYAAHGLPDFESNEKACSVWRRYANLFETSQSLFWAGFGLIDLVSFELTGIKDFTRFWALLMFGSYSVINIIVLLNMLIAMMSNSYEIISEHCDTEWKFARSRLWLNYFEGGDTLPPPFNILPTPKSISHLFCCRKHFRIEESFKIKSQATERYETVMRQIIRRYITAEQKKRDVCDISEDDVMEIRQDISMLRYELISILRRNGMRTPQVSEEDMQVSTRKDKIMKRRILGDFCIGTVEKAANIALSKNVFSQIAKVVRKRSSLSRRQNWNALVRRHTINQNHIGSSQIDTKSQQQGSLKKCFSDPLEPQGTLAGENGQVIASVDSLRSSAIKNEKMGSQIGDVQDQRRFASSTAVVSDDEFQGIETGEENVSNINNDFVKISDSSNSEWL